MDGGNILNLWSFPNDICVGLQPRLSTVDHSLASDQKQLWLKFTFLIQIDSTLRRIWKCLLSKNLGPIDQFIHFFSFKTSCRTLHIIKLFREDIWTFRWNAMGDTWYFCMWFLPHFLEISIGCSLKSMGSRTAFGNKSVMGTEVSRAKFFHDFQSHASLRDEHRLQQWWIKRAKHFEDFP